MVYLIIALVLAVAALGILAWRLRAALQARRRAEQECRAMRKDNAIRHNLEQILSARDAEIRRLRGKVRQYEADAQALEDRASELNVNLFRESGLRILAEKEESANRMKLEQLERQLADSRQALRDAQAREAALQDLVDEQQRRLDKLGSERGRRARRSPADSGLDQVTMEDILSPR
ncbi:MAG: hypothetical protein IJJ45_04895 [Clostridia bacterium]|nr:hypothetical protein [Clostridia bacterium]MBQ6373808.1 hypothetical protein [Clostridia bacterium]